jgi:hypothetical protein
MNHRPQIRGKRRCGKPRKGFVHDLHRPDLFLRKLIGALKVVYLYLAGIGNGFELLRIAAARIYRGKKLVYFILRENLGHTPIIPNPQSLVKGRWHPSLRTLFVPALFIKIMREKQRLQFFWEKTIFNAL